MFLARIPILLLLETSTKILTIKYANIIDNTTEIVTSDPVFASRYLKECLNIQTNAERENEDLRSLVVLQVQKEIETVEFGSS